MATNKPKNLRFKPVELVAFWNAMKDWSEACCLAPELSGWTKRFQVMARSEIDYWNALTLDEREVILDEDIQIDIQKLPVEKAPEWHPPHLHDEIKKIFDGDIEKPQSKLERLIATKSKKQ